MLKSLQVENLILMEQATVDFQKGFTVITGETGSGKTALIQALRLILGERADATKVRKGAEKARVQGVFSLESTQLAPLFAESGVPYPEEEDLIIVREITASGKGRAFANSQQVPAAFLQKIAPYLVDFIGQHAQVALKTPQNQRVFLDLFSGADLHPFQKALLREKQLAGDLATLREDREKSAREAILIQEQIDELNEAGVQEGEAENLFEEYTLISNASELLMHAENALGAIKASRESNVQLKGALRSIEKLSDGLSETTQMAEESLLLFQEMELAIHSFQSKLESDPGRLQFLEERLALVEKLQKTYGKNLSSVLNSLEVKAKTLDTLDEREEELVQEYAQAQFTTNEEAGAITALRTKGANTLSKILSDHLRHLNIPHAEVEVRLHPSSRTNDGDEEVHFYLRANKGEQITPVKDSSSGGELSRLLFSMKIALAEKSRPPTMVFDEIDANVGGQTATKMAALLQQLSSERQILCITHFPQVARAADHHLTVTKTETEKRTEGHIQTLSEEEKEEELARMLGH